MTKRKPQPKHRDQWLENVVIPVIHQATQGAGKRTSVSAICEKSGVCRTTITNWMDKKTMRPQRSTMDAVLRALGYEMGLVDSASGQLVQFDRTHNAIPAPIRRNA